jgi:hypothetical protein
VSLRARRCAEAFVKIPDDKMTFLPNLNVKTTLTVLAILATIEIALVLVLLVTTAQRRKILEANLRGQPLETLNPTQREAVLSQSDSEFSKNKTLYRVVEMLVVMYHMPALASWTIFTRKPATPPPYYYGVTIVFWFLVVITVTKLRK